VEGRPIIIESVAAASAILSAISSAINKINEIGDGGMKAVELMQGFSDALDSFEREKKDSMLTTLSSQELLKLESIKHRRDQFEKSLHDMLVIHDPALLMRWDEAKARQKAAHKRQMAAIKARAAARKKMITQIWTVLGVTAIGVIVCVLIVMGVVLVFR
tara:strand:- start:1619 stop:2098 length:480 start_codon:yes stop_codon:yes gene_type:complete